MHLQPWNIIYAAPGGIEMNVLEIMRRQHELTSLLVQQQCLSSLAKRDIEVFDDDPLQNHAFIMAFENFMEEQGHRATFNDSQ